jgi:hypothetical protein
MKISGNDLLDFTSAKAATGSYDLVDMVSKTSWDELRSMDESEITLSLFGTQGEPNVVFNGYFISIRALKSEAIKRLGFDRRPIGVYP